MIQEFHLIPVPFCSLPLLSLFVVASLFGGATWSLRLDRRFFRKLPLLRPCVLSEARSVCWGSWVAQPAPAHSGQQVTLSVCVTGANTGKMYGAIEVLFRSEHPSDAF